MNGHVNSTAELCQSESTDDFEKRSKYGDVVEIGLQHVQHVQHVEDVVDGKSTRVVVHVDNESQTHDKHAKNAIPLRKLVCIIAGLLLSIEQRPITVSTDVLKLCVKDIRLSTAERSKFSPS